MRAGDAATTGWSREDGSGAPKDGELPKGFRSVESYAEEGGALAGILVGAAELAVGVKVI